jgi:hypothetical protein
LPDVEEKLNNALALETLNLMLPVATAIVVSFSLTVNAVVSQTLFTVRIVLEGSVVSAQ